MATGKFLQKGKTAERLETDDCMDTNDLLRQADKMANARPNILQNYIVIAILCLFGVMFFFQWRQNSASPDKLISIMEKSVQANTDSLKVQEQSLAKIQEFSIQVPMEHADAARKIDSNGVVLGQMRTEQSELRMAIKANSEAIQKNTEAVARLIGAIEQKTGLDPNVQPPSN